MIKHMRSFHGGIIVLTLLLSCSLSGCWFLVIGGVAAAGGYAVSRDTIQGETTKSFDEVWRAAKETVAIMGTVNSESYELGQIKGVINGAKVTVNVLQLTPSAVRLRVKARKFVFQSIANAQNIYLKIMNKVNQVSDE